MHVDRSDEGTGPVSAEAGCAGEENEMSFEDAFTRLEVLTRRLESGEASLEESLELFEEGVRLARLCSTRLDEAEAKVRVLTEGPGGELLSSPFAGREEDPST